jgi:hypothetical protein
MKPVAWITGAGGLVGSYLLRTASRWAPDWDVRGLTDRMWISRTRRQFAFGGSISRSGDPCAAIIVAVCEQDRWPGR